jgi:hypothetical protein
VLQLAEADRDFAWLEECGYSGDGLPGSPPNETCSAVGFGDTQESTPETPDEDKSLKGEHGLARVDCLYGCICPRVKITSRPVNKCGRSPL